MIQTLVKFGCNYNTAGECLEAQTSDIWNTFIEKVDLDGRCLTNFNIVWLGMKPKADNECESEIGIVQEHGADLSKLQCEQHAKISFFLIDTLLNNTVSISVDGKEMFTYTGTNDSVDDYVSDLNEYCDVVRAYRNGNKITILMPNKYANKKVEANNIDIIGEFARINLLNDKACICDSDYFRLNIYFPKKAGCYYLAIIDKTNPNDIKYLWYSNRFTVKDKCFNELVTWKGNAFIDNTIGSDYNRTRLPILDIVRAGNKVNETIKSQANSDPKLGRIAILPQWQFYTDSLTAEMQDYMLYVLKSDTLIIRGKRMVFEGNLDVNNGQAMGILTEVGAGLNNYQCNVDCDSSNMVNIDFGNTLDDVSIIAIDSQCVMYDLTTLKQIPKGKYCITIINYQSREIELMIDYSNGMVIKIKPNTKKILTNVTFY